MLDTMMESPSATPLAARPTTTIKTEATELKYCNKEAAIEREEETTPTATTPTAPLPTTPLATTPSNTNCNSPNCTPTKSKSLLTWLRGATKTLDSDVGNSSNNNKNISSSNSCDNNNCTCEEAPAARAKPADYREFRGVQSLRHLWNKRISANAGASANGGTGDEGRSLGSAARASKKLTKSISCLVSATAHLYEARASGGCGEATLKRRRAQTKRAQSLHDCTQLDSEPEAEPEAASTEAIAEIDCVHRERDNFYKYKTAEQASKHWGRRGSDSKTATATATTTASATATTTAEGGAHFPATGRSERGERIHWPRWDELAMTAKRAKAVNGTGDTGSSDDVRKLRRTRRGGCDDDTKSRLVSATCDDEPTDAALSLNISLTSTGDSDHDSLSTETSDTLTNAANSPRRRSTKTTSTVARRESHSKRSSGDSSTAGGGTGGGRSRRPPPSARKYSFKTHSKSYHSPRKLHAAKADGGGGGGAGGGGGIGVGGPGVAGSVVAKLTQQFNEIIQKDKKLLQEVKRKNGVLMSRGGHVYKVVEARPGTSGGGLRASSSFSASPSGASSPSVSRAGSKAKELSAKGSVVRRTIRKFESGSRGDGATEGEKPKVPTKSLQVLRKREELVSGRGQRKAAASTSATASEKPQGGDQQQLAVVREEAKTQLDGEAEGEHDGGVNEGQNAEVETVTIASESNVPIDKEEITYIGICSRGRLSNANNLVNNNNETQDETNDTQKESVSSNTISNKNSRCNDDDNRTDDRANTVGQDDNIVEAVGDSDVQQRLPPEGQEADASHLEQRQQRAKTEANGATAAVPTAAAAASGEGDEAIAAAMESRKDNKNSSSSNKNKNDNQNKSHDSTNDHGDPDGSGAANADGGEERQKQRKHKYAKIYEKFRFRSPFGKKSSSPSSSPTTPTGSPTKGGGDGIVSAAVDPALTVTNKTTPTSTSANEAEAKLLDALEVVDQKLKGLAGDEQRRARPSESPAASIVLLAANDDFEQRLLPNSSFVFQSTAKQVSGGQLVVTQAVNVALVNNIVEGEQMLLQEQQLLATETAAATPMRVVEIPTTTTTTTDGANMAAQEVYREINKEARMERERNVRKEEREEAPKEGPMEGPMEEPKEEPTAKPEGGPQEEEEEIYEPIAEALPPKTATTPSPQNSFIFQRCRSLHAATEAKNDGLDGGSQLMDDIYQTLEEIHTERTRLVEVASAPNPAPAVGSYLDDYESIAGSCEQRTPVTTSASTSTSVMLHLYDGYEICQPPPPDGSSAGLTAPQPATMGRNTNDELPALPEPKRKLPKSPMPGKKLPPKPQKPPPAVTLDGPPTLATPPAARLIGHNAAIDDDGDDDHHYYADDENIYDTIKGSHCYESLQSTTTSVTTSVTSKSGSKSSTTTATSTCILKSLKSSHKSLDTVSLSSNCYESIAQYRRVAAANSVAAGVGASVPLRNAGSTSTISSDHKTNSLYEVSLVAGLPYGGVGGPSRRGSSVISGCGPVDAGSAGNGSIGSGSGSTGIAGDGTGHIHYAPSNAASSENSDEWVDITDNEADPEGGGGADSGGGAVKQQFIVVRERSRVHRSPDWSKRVRDKRLQQKKAISCIEDDSDHYYESLSPLGNKRHSMQLVKRSNSHLKRNQDHPRYALNGSQRRQQKHSVSAHALGQAVSDDYDSFDTDTDEIYEAEENLKNHNDSGVDIRNMKLPDPPASTNQVYAMVRKLKNFISNKKSPNSSKYGGSQQKIYENSSQFYVEGNIYQSSPKSSTKAGKGAGSKKAQGRKSASQSQSAEDNNVYENTEFHTPPTIVATPTALRASEKNLSSHGSNSDISHGLATTIPNSTGVGMAGSIAAEAATPRSKSKSGKSFKSRLRKSLVGSTFDSKQLSTLTPTRSTFYIEDPSSQHGGSGELDSGFSEKASTGDLSTDAPTAAGDPLVPSAEAQKFCTVARKAKKEAKSSNAQRRRTTIGIRPHEPPPPPPPAENHQVAKHRSTASNTSWYAECGVFKNGTSLNHEHTQQLLHGGEKLIGNGRASTQSHNGGGSMSLAGTSWYTEAGLYQTSGASVASSSGSSGVSTGNEAVLGDDLPHSMFQNEPLYQIYSAAKLQSISRDMEDQDGGSTDGYEEIGQHGGGDRAGRGAVEAEEGQRRARPTALQLVGPKSGPSRTLWSEIPEVINSCILPTLTPRERGLQEAKFEIITSEASYLKSLNLLRSHFMNHPVFRDTTVVSARDRKALFSYIVPVHECSERLLTALEACWQDNIMLLGLSHSIYATAEKYFHVYISFCEHQGRMDRTLRRLKESRGTFAQNLDLLEASPTCCGLNLHSFLMLPMQRITRLPLLIDAVFSKVSPNDDEYESWKMTLAIMNKIVTQCNEAANRCEQAYEIERIARQLEFPTTIRALAIAPVGVAAPGSKPRFLVKKGELTHLIWRGDDAKLTFGKKFTKSTVFAFLFSDLLVLTKRKAEEQFQVFDYCPRNMLTISSGDLLPQLPTKDINQTGKNLIMMTLLENHERKTVELVLSCPSVSEQERWLQAMRPPEAETPGEKLYEQWDCPQVVAKHAYESKEPDALNLEQGDVVNVTRKLPDGWYQGERIRDGAIGWFPGNFTEEVNSAHVRARNLKQRYRLLTFTATYLESQKRK